MHCSNCNKTIPDGSTHCPYCYSAQSGESAYEPTDDVLKEKYGKPFIGIPTIVTIVILYAIIIPYYSVLSTKNCVKRKILSFMYNFCNNGLRFSLQFHAMILLFPGTQPLLSSAKKN